MSLAINIDEVDRVLLADGWHEVANQSFEIDAYEFTGPNSDIEHMRLVGGQEALLPAAGATWMEVYEGHEAIPGTAIARPVRKAWQYFCPLTAVLAVRYSPITSKPKK